ncbi:dihydrofolate reductase family protein [Flavobacterium amniphilum]|uniref:dihydrofolate reductase family protein n=1 Tax=Flavobacterium amniphilum TaxID=1834035 RepID=UPI00202A7A0C|nr:dihydrofolate reductase family protein [Flavobacterium amniphilum]MCL9806649.1 dihydrofolate reductase family protein [Flavobacterium amniphilum]
MRKIIILSMLSLDGVMQGPGGPEEDTSNGFEYGGWTAAFGDPVFGEALKKEMEPSDYLLGRKTFEIWENYWPNHNHFWPAINAGTKYVLSKTVKDSDWNNSIFLENVAEIKALKHTDGPDLQVWGSSELVQLLLQHDLSDVLTIKTFPVILGKGKKLFADNAIPAAFTLKENLVTPKGVIIATYERDGDVKTGTAGG